MYHWQFLLLPVLFLYIALVALAAEVTVKCRAINTKFDEPEIIGLFTFFEIEVFAFFGIMIGLYLWLTIKYTLNTIYSAGPLYVFKTLGVKKARDTLVRNYEDAYIFMGLIWTLATNAYLNSNLNKSYEYMNDKQHLVMR